MFNTSMFMFTTVYLGRVLRLISLYKNKQFGYKQNINNNNKNK